MEVLAPELRVEKETTDAETLKEWRTRGLKEMSENTVGVILMAGGQGTRLGKRMIFFFCLMENDCFKLPSFTLLVHLCLF